MGYAEVNAMVSEREELTTFECHQALHGYGDGHELLGSSISIPRGIRSTMLMLSDLSGPSIVEGFREYCTGYPITSEGYYALSRTWDAAEMPRPGCVWTHTLLLPANILTSIVNINELVSLFSRPSEYDRKTAFRKYADPLRFTTASKGEPRGLSQWDQNSREKY
jgi:hypothetical protein